MPQGWQAIGEYGVLQALWVKPFDCVLYLSELRSALATQGLAIVPAADVPTPEERAILNLSDELLGGGDCWPSRSDAEPLLSAVRIRRAAKEPQ